MITVWPSNTYISLKHKSNSTHSMVPPDFYIIAESNQSWHLQVISNEYKIPIIYSCKTWLNQSIVSSRLNCFILQFLSFSFFFPSFFISVLSFMIQNSLCNRGWIQSPFLILLNDDYRHLSPYSHLRNPKRWCDDIK